MTAKEKKTSKETEEQLLNKAFQLLSYRPRSHREIRLRLSRFARRRRFPAATESIKRVLNRLKKKGKIDDLEFAKWWIGQRVEFKPRGKKLLRSELLKKGVDERLINQALAYHWTGEEDALGTVRKAVSETELARRAADKKAKALLEKDEKEFSKKLRAYLLRRGFEYETAKSTAKEVKNKHYE